MVTCPKCSHKFDPPKPAGYSEDFLAFWKAYDAVKKTPSASKSDAFKAWNQIASYRPPLNNLLYAVKGYQQNVLKSNGITCHPSTWLRQGRYESFLPTPGTDVPPVAITSPDISTTSGPSVQLVHSSWGANGDLISREIGPAKFIAWFRDAELTPATGDCVPIITVNTSLKREWIATHYAHALYKVLGNFEIVVRRER